ncbi:hypothetical protein Tco_0860917 [Tanacetum coccineum]|uniref:Tf2-1-like SH3-like domain-containing protein n=1 Tax=Tanacetum coccineum TaxID=301880 RepID=A0ABQ5BGD2_9ASTR
MEVLEHAGVCYALGGGDNLSKYHNEMEDDINVLGSIPLECLVVFYFKIRFVLLEGLHVDDKLHFVEELIEIMNLEVKQLRRSRVPIVKDEEDKEEEEHLAPADPSAIPTNDPLHTISSCFLRPNPVQYGCLFNIILHDHHLPRTRGSRMAPLRTIRTNNRITRGKILAGLTLHGTRRRNITADLSRCRRHLIPNPKPRSRDTSLVALGKSAIKFARQKSYADVRRKPVKFQVDNLVMLKGLERVESIAYKLKLPQELSRVHNTFHISNLKKCCSDDPLAIPLEGLHIDDKFHLVEEPVVIMDRDIKRLKSKPYPNC